MRRSALAFAGILAGAHKRRGISGPGIKDHVKVYEYVVQFPSTGGDMTICLRPGDEVRYNATANDRGDSHTWAMGC
ncbi:hypothetical protein [Streptomyces sp. NPDC002187]|uniref:hypothetical protein n=1 Tax=Streptomyces sp. NPDC002187 TaxID=3364637 RepID=UPI0036817D52